MQTDQQACLLVIVSDLALRNTLVDWLLSNHGDMIFSTASVDCYGLDPDTLTAAEQVTGRQNKLEFQIQASLGTAREICRGLGVTFPTVKLRYRILPLVEGGYL